MFPIGDENNDRRLTPYVNLALIALNVVIFLYELTLPRSFPDNQLVDFTTRWGVIPAEIVRHQHLETLVTSMFLHGSWAHIAFNMLFLWIFGDNVEDMMGHAKYLLFYLICGVVAALTQVWTNPDSMVPVIGASGAIAGVLGAYIVLFPFGNIRTLVLISIFPIIFLLPAWIWIGLWILLQLVSGVGEIAQTSQTGGGVAYFAHLGGFAAGAILIWLLRDPAAYARQKAARAHTRAFQRLG